MLTVSITRLRNDVALPAYATPGAIAFDLSSDADLTVPAHQYALVPTGIIVTIPPGFGLILSARSSLLRKKSLMLGNGIGVIDQDYCGPADELKLLLWNTTAQDVAIAKGERLAQGMFVPIERVAWKEIALSERSSSRGGFGTSGGYQ